MRFCFGFAAFLVVSASLWFLACGGPEFTTASPDGGPSVGSDGGVATDGATDAGGPFCPNDAYDFCADFDQSPLNVEWTDVATSGGATGAHDDDASVSPPNSYLAIAPALTTVDAGASAVLSELSLPKGQTHFTFDLRIDEIDFPNASDPNAAVIVAAYAQGPVYLLSLELHPAAGGAAPFEPALLERTVLTDGGIPVYKLTPLDGAFTTVGVWYHVEIDFTIDAAANPLAVPASLSVTSGSPPTTTTKLVTLSPPIGTALGQRSIAVGVVATAVTGQAKIRFDNVTYSH